MFLKSAVPNLKILFKLSLAMLGDIANEDLIESNLVLTHRLKTAIKDQPNRQLSIGI
jgi:hypothetical protein